MDTNLTRAPYVLEKKKSESTSNKLTPTNRPVRRLNRRLGYQIPFIPVSKAPSMHPSPHLPPNTKLIPCFTCRSTHQLTTTIQSVKKVLTFTDDHCSGSVNILLVKTHEEDIPFQMLRVRVTTMSKGFFF